MASTYTRQCQQIVREYRLSGAPWPARSIDIAEWAIATGKWDIPRASKLRVCREDIAEAMAHETVTDESGRRVRLKHAFRTRRDGVLGSFWGDIRTMDHDEMALNVSQRRRGVVAELAQMSNDKRYFERLHPDWPQIPLPLDFTNDLREIDQDYTDQAA